ncbi:MAG: potassium channel family protein [Desulfuromonadales bacterium]
MSNSIKRFANFWWGDRGLSAFLLLLLTSLFLKPFFHSPLLRGLSDVFFSLLLISGVAYISPRPLLRWIAGTLALVAIVLHWLQEYLVAPWVATAASLLTLLFLIFLTLVVLARVFREKGPVTSARVQGAVAAYLLFGITWGVLYKFLFFLFPASIHFPATAGVNPAEQGESLTYFSFVTLTTLGYGDITPVHPVTQMFVGFEALVGQLYPATLLARLVSLELTARQEPVLEENLPSKSDGGAP